MQRKLIEIIYDAGKELNTYFQAENMSVSYKGEIDLVTEYDIAIEKLLTAEFNKAFSDYTVIGEESSSNKPVNSGKVIYLDPIDGTTNFVHRFPFSAISAGVAVDGELTHGVVYSPMLGELYSAEKGKGAFLNGKPIRVSAADAPIRSLFSTGFPYDREKRREATPLFYHMLDISQGMRRTGSAALDLCYTARGTFDLYYESELNPWDISVGILIVQEAGGKVTGIDGKRHDLSKNMIVASNGIVHEMFLTEMRGIYGK